MAAPTFFLSPGAKALCASIPSEQNVVSAIARVLFSSHPSEVSRFIVSISINAIKLMVVARRLSNLCTDICGKDCVVTPRGVHGYSSAPIRRVSLMLGVKAAPSGVFPRMMQACSNFAVVCADSPGPPISHPYRGGL